jgi:rhodanese-related sulfurtransferase
MRAALAEIARDELVTRIEGGEPLVLVDALGPISYGAAHLPGAINMPPERVDALADRRIPSLDDLVVVYCANPACESSVEVAERLVELGYRNVLHYAGGKEDWASVGLPLEGARVSGGS